MNEWMKNRSSKGRCSEVLVGLEKHLNQLVALISTTKLISPIFFICKYCIGECFSREQNFRAAEWERRTDTRKCSSSWLPLHGVVLEILWNTSLDHLSWRRKGETLIYRLLPSICQRFTSWDKFPTFLGCIWFSREQVPVASHSVVSIGKH